jgi:hypothetical protein
MLKRTGFEHMDNSFSRFRMGTVHHENERCETCRFWDSETSECHRRAPMTTIALGVSSSLKRTASSRTSTARVKDVNRAWPRTQADDWCGEWDSHAAKAVMEDSALPVGQAIATRTFLGRIAPSLESHDPETLLEALLNQLSPDIRRVIVRMNGLDGQPLRGLKEVAREFRMSREQLRGLIESGEKRLAEVVAQLADRQ